MRRERNTFQVVFDRGAYQLCLQGPCSKDTSLALGRLLLHHLSRITEHVLYGVIWTLINLDADDIDKIIRMQSSVIIQHILVSGVAFIKRQLLMYGERATARKDCFLGWQ